MKQEAQINPETLKHARKREGLSIAALAAKLTVVDAETKLRAWESGASLPSVAQARALAGHLHVPFTMLFMSPAIVHADEALPDLRTVSPRGESGKAATKRKRFSSELRDVYQDALRKQGFVHEQREAQGSEPLAFVGSGRGADSYADGARAIRSLLAVTSADRANASHAERYLSLLVRRAEAAGVLVLRSSTVGANTHRSLDVDEFRGFAIADDLAPLVFINTADAKAAQVFTFIHELAHLWRAETGISKASLDASNEEADAEAFCDSVAAEFLVPARELQGAWISLGQPISLSGKKSLKDNVERLFRAFRVGRFVVARRALDLKLTTRREFGPYFKEHYRAALKLESLVSLTGKKANAKSGPVPQGLLINLRNGESVVGTVTTALRNGEVLWRDAGRLLGISMNALEKLARLDGATS